MTVTTTLDRQYFPGDGANKNFPFNFKFFDNSQIYVFLVAPDGSIVGRTLNVDYTLSGASSPGGGQVVMSVAPALNYRLLVQRIISPTQPTSIRNQGAFFPAIHEDVFDRLTMLIQQSLANDAISMQLDLSGSLWDFRGHRGVNAADPVDPQDVVTKNWVGAYLDSVSGLVNTTNGIAYDGGTLYDFLKFGVGRTVNTISALRLLSSSRNQKAFVLGYYALGDGGGGAYYVDVSDTTSTDNGGSVIVAGDGARWKLKIEGRIRSQQFGIVSGVAASQHVQLQRLVTYGCTYTGGVDFQFGQIRTDQTITFPNLAFDLVGSSGTGTEFVTDVTNLKIFDFSSCNGPAKTMQRIGFSKITPGTYAGIIGVWTNNTNGLYLENVWARGLLQGLRYHGSFINLQNCAFEYNYYGIWCDSKCQETVWSGTTYYRNEQADFRLTGNNATFASVGSNHIGSRIEGIRLDDCTNAQISAVSFEDDGTGFTPNLLHVTGVSSGNIVTGFSTSAFGKYGIYLEGANVKKNTITGINLRGVQATGNRGIRCVSSSDNYLEGNVEGFEAGVEFNTCSDEFSGRVAGCGIGQLLTAANYCVLDVINSGNTTDVSATSTTIIHLKNFAGVRTGLDGIPYILTNRGYNDEVLTNAIPTALTWKQGDTAVNRLPTANNPSRWRCVVGGTPGTWKPGEVLGA